MRLPLIALFFCRSTSNQRSYKNCTIEFSISNLLNLKFNHLYINSALLYLLHLLFHLHTKCRSLYHMHPLPQQTGHTIFQPECTSGDSSSSRCTMYSQAFHDCVYWFTTSVVAILERLCSSSRSRMHHFHHYSHNLRHFFTTSTAATLPSAHRKFILLPRAPKKQ